MPTYEHEGVTAQFCDALSGISVSALLSNQGDFHLSLSGDARGELFTLSSPAYCMALTVANGVVELRRNGHVARTAIGPVEHCFQIRASWEPEWFQLALMADDRKAAADAPVCGVRTQPIFVPLDLVEWARRLRLLPRAVYGSQGEFLGVVLDCLRQTGRWIRDAGCHGLFWDERRRALGGTRLRPKQEPEAMSALAAFLQDRALLHGFDLVREIAAGAGPVRYRAVGPLASGGSTSVCLTASDAHADGLAHGVTDLLPAYMEHTGADHGIYLVLWYRCHAFRHPKSNGSQIMWDLTTRKPWGNIVVETLDLAMPDARGHRRSENAQRRRRRLLSHGPALRLTS